MTLQEIYNKLLAQGYESDKGTIHSYIPVYEEILAPYRETAKNILEIGLLSGASLRMWEQYFSGIVYGIDCDLKPIGGRYDLQPMIDEGTHKIIIGDAEDPAILEKHFSGIKFDVIIEDANHSYEQQIKLLKNLIPYLNEGAIYVIEDIQNIDAGIWNLSPYEWGWVVNNNNKTIQIIDRRHILNRYDDVLVVIK